LAVQRLLLSKSGRTAWRGYRSTLRIAVFDEAVD
jgi:hypothetical protein